MKFKSVLVLFLCVCFVFTAEAKDFKSIAERVTPSIVEVTVLRLSDFSKRKRQLKHVGSGVAVKHNIVATNCSILKSSDEVFLVKSRWYSPAEIIASNPKEDICILRVRGMILKAVKLRPSENLMKGEEVYVINSRNLKSGITNKGKVSGIINSGSTILFVSDKNPSDFGGPIFDSFGNLIGIIRSGSLAKKTKQATSSNWIIETLNITPHSVKPNFRK